MCLVVHLWTNSSIAKRFHRSKILLCYPKLHPTGKNFLLSAALGIAIWLSRTLPAQDLQILRRVFITKLMKICTFLPQSCFWCKQSRETDWWRIRYLLTLKADLQRQPISWVIPRAPPKAKHYPSLLSTEQAKPALQQCWGWYVVQLLLRAILNELPKLWWLYILGVHIQLTKDVNEDGMEKDDCVEVFFRLRWVGLLGVGEVFEGLREERGIV